MKKLFVTIASAAAILSLTGCWAPRFVNVTSDAVRLTVEDKPETPYRIEGVDRNLSAPDAIAFLKYYYDNHRDDSYPDLIYSNQATQAVPDEESVKLELSALSRKYFFTIYGMPPLTGGKSAYPMIEVKETWNKYNNSGKAPKKADPVPAGKSN